jgi:hypothetical protein
MFRLWTVVARVICALQTWSAEVLANDVDVLTAESSETSATPQPRGKILPFRRSRIA